MKIETSRLVNVFVVHFPPMLLAITEREFVEGNYTVVNSLHLGRKKIIVNNSENIIPGSLPKALNIFKPI